MKFKKSKRFIFRTLGNLVMFYILPIYFLFFSGFFTIRINNWIIAIFLILLYGIEYISSMSKGFLAIIELIFNKYVREKATFDKTIIKEELIMFANPRHDKKIQQTLDTCYTLWHSNNGDLLLANSEFINLEENAKYSIEYGKYSKILISIEKLD